MPQSWHSLRVVFDLLLSVQAQVKEPELYELHERVKQIRKALDDVPDCDKDALQQELSLEVTTQ